MSLGGGARSCHLCAAFAVTSWETMSVSPKETAAFLLRRYAKRQRAEADRREQVKRLASSIIRRHLGAGRRAWLFGSVAWGGFGRGSDLDIAVEGIPPADAARLELELVTTVRIEVDLVRLEELPASFAERIRAEGVPIDE